MPNQFSIAGANSGKQTRLAALYNGRWSSGIWTNRSPLRDATTSRISEKFYGPAGDALIDGINTEISNRLTLVRRPGNQPFGPLATNVDRFYDFRIFGPTTEQILIMIDQANALYSYTYGAQHTNLVFSKSVGAGQSYMQSVGNTLYWGDGVDNKKWLQTLFTWQPNMAWNTPTTPYLSTFIYDPNGNIQQLTGTGIGIQAVYVANDTVEIFTGNYGLTSVLSPGDQVTFPTNMVASFLNGHTVTVNVVQGMVFIFNFAAANYLLTDEYNVYATVYPGDGTPFSGSTPPIWSTTVPSALNDFQGGITYDGTVQWTNRGNPVENWGIQPPTDVLKPVVQTVTSTWAADTYYSYPGVIFDSNGNLQEVETKGLSGTTEPLWATNINGFTQEGSPSSGVAWTCITTANLMAWKPNFFYNTGTFIVGNAAGTPSLFQSGPPTGPYLSGSVSASLWVHPHSGAVGTWDGVSPYTGSTSPPSGLPYPTAPGTAVATATGLTSFDFAISGTGTGGSFAWNTVNSSGAVTGTTNPFPGRDVSDLYIVIQGTLQVPVSGNYVFTLSHGDGLQFGIGGGAILVSGTAAVNLSGTNTALGGFPYFQAGTNENVTANSGAQYVDTYTVQLQAGSTYPMEVNMARWDKANAGLSMKVAGNTLPSAQPTGGATSGNVQPTWPPFSTANAPLYATVSESGNRLSWSNLGPVTDFQWAAHTNFSLPATKIIDVNQNYESSFRTGISGSTSPVFSLYTNALTADNPNLIWINQGAAPAAAKGTVSVSNGGWVYSISLVNTLDDTVSNATPISAPTGNFNGAFGVKLEPGDGLGNISDIDPQADYVAIWRSTDGQVQPFLIPGNNDFGLPITISLHQYLLYGYDDTTPDTGLNNLIEAPILGENTPPAAGASNLAYYLGRIFYSIGNTVYWTSGPDTPAGNGLNGTSPLNFDEQVSLVKRIVPLTVGAIVFTVSDINLITGNGTTNSPIQAAVPLIAGVGLSSYNALDVNGSTIGFFSTDSQFLIMDPSNGISSAGFPIGDQLRLNNGVPGQSWDPTMAYVAWHVNGEDQAWYLADGKNGWFRLMPTPAPESGGYTWSPFASIVTGCQCVQSIEVQPGQHELLLAPVTNGQILARSFLVNTDGGQTYPAYATLGSCVLAQPGQVAFVSFITTESVNVGIPTVLGIIVDEAYPYYKGPFEYLKHWKNDPPTLRPSTSILGQRFYMDEAEDFASLMRHMQIQINWAAENAPNEMLTLTIFGGFLQEE
jgi:hypothetical protein